MIENTNTKQFYPGPILNNTLEITDFLFNDAEQIKITHSKLNEEGILVDVDLNYPTDYEVTKVLPSDINAAEAALTASTGQVLLKNVTVLAGEKLTVYRLSQIIQDKDYPRTGAFPAATHEGALDYLTMQNQEQREEIARSLKVPISTPNFNAAVPVPLPNRILRINNDAAGFEFVPYDLDERLDTFEDTIEETIVTNQAKIEADFNSFKVETNNTLSENKTELEGIIADNRQEVLDIQSDYQEEMDLKFQTVSDAADKINELETAVDTAVAAATTAVESVQNIEETSDQLKEEIIQEAETQLENIKSTGFYMRNDNLYFINSKGEEEEFRAGGGLPMFAHIWSDHIYKDVSYLRADTFSWHDERIYKTGYEILEEQYDNEDSVIEVKDGITYKRTPDGFKIADETQQDAIRSLYETKGIAWIYIIDKANKRFKLPRTKYGFTGVRDKVGGDVEAGLPSISHTHTWSGTTSSNGAHTHTVTYGSRNGAGSENPYTDFSRTGSKATSSSNGAHTHTISGTTSDNTEVNSIYGKSNTVQPPATQMYLYFYVGNYKRPETELELGKITEVLNDLGDLNDVVLKKNQIANCITEIPQRIKYDLTDGVLTIKAGSVVIVPYGIENLTAQYPVGTTFLNDNFKVVDTQYADGKFFVWAELVGDLVREAHSTTSTVTRYSFLNIDINTCDSFAVGGSGTGFSDTTSCIYYNVTSNVMQRYNTGGILSEYVCCFPFMMVTANGTYVEGSVDQVFNGMGYIGSTVWIDKGVRVLIPDGRNEDGTLKNIEFTTDKLLSSTTSAANNAGMYITISSTGKFMFHSKTVSTGNRYYDENKNLVMNTGNISRAILGEFQSDANKNIINYNSKLAFHAVDYNDKREVSTWALPSTKSIDLTLGASGSTYMAPANGWFYLVKTASATNQYLNIYNKTASWMGMGCNSSSSGQQTRVYVPVKKGDEAYVSYNMNGSNTNYDIFVFIYAEGEI